TQDYIAVFWFPFDSVTTPFQSLGCDDLRSAAGKWFIAKLALFGMLAHWDCEDLDRFGGWVLGRLERRALDHPRGRWIIASASLRLLAAEPAEEARLVRPHIPGICKDWPAFHPNDLLMNKCPKLFPGGLEHRLFP